MCAKCLCAKLLPRRVERPRLEGASLGEVRLDCAGVESNLEVGYGLRRVFLHQIGNSAVVDVPNLINTDKKMIQNDAKRWRRTDSCSHRHKTIPDSICLGKKPKLIL